MKQKLIEHISSIKAEQSETLDGLQVTKILAQEVTSIARQAFTQSQNSDSIDQRIEFLVNGLQACANHVVEAFNGLETKNQQFESKIEALETLLNEINTDEGKESFDISDEAVDVEPSKEDLDHDEKKV